MRVPKSVLWMGVVGVGMGVEGMSLQELLVVENSTLSMFNALLATHPTLLPALQTTPNITILVPNNAAFLAYLSTPDNAATASNPDPALLQYHVLNGVFPSSAFERDEPLFVPTLLVDTAWTNVTGGQVVQGEKNAGGKVEFISALKEKSTVAIADLAFTNGILHIIDKVLTLPITPSFSALDSNLTAFGGALAQARLYHGLNEMSDVTIFAPSNAAFQAVGSVATAMTSEQLSTLLQYHIIPSQILRSPQLQGLTAQTSTFTTAQGGTVKINMLNGEMFVNSARILESDILVSNGVLHVLDNVLNPSNPSVPPEPGVKTQAPVFSIAAAAVTGGDVPFTSGIVPTTTAPSARQTGLARKVEGKVGVAMLFGIGAAGFVAL